jgi:hypothetical protein
MTRLEHTGNDNCDKFRAKLLFRGMAARVRIRQLSVGGKNTLCRGQKERIGVSAANNFSRARAVVQQVRVNHADL